MTIKEVAQRTGLARSNIRFYEKEKLISPNRNTGNGYREYSEEDVQTIKKIAYLRTLGISVEDIRRLSCREADLYDVIKVQRQNLEQQLTELESAKRMCERMLSSAEKINYENLDVEMYVTDKKDYWSKNSHVFKLDSVSFFYMWGGVFMWALLTAACLFTAAASFGCLPGEIPVQWSGGMASSFADKKFIFAFPAACVLIRFLLHPFIRRWLEIHMNIIGNDSITDSITDYITNYLCFTVLSIQIFIILFIKEIMKHVTILIFMDSAVLIGLLAIAVHKMMGKNNY